MTSAAVALLETIRTGTQISKLTNKRTMKYRRCYSIKCIGMDEVLRKIVAHTDTVERS